jgi:hypothetical protein
MCLNPGSPATISLAETSFSLDKEKSSTLSWTRVGHQAADWASVVQLSWPTSHLDPNDHTLRPWQCIMQGILQNQGSNGFIRLE